MTYEEIIQRIKLCECNTLPTLRTSIQEELAYCYSASIEQGHEPNLSEAVYHLQRLAQLIHPKEVSKLVVAIIIVLLERQASGLMVDIEAARSFKPPIWE